MYAKLNIIFLFTACVVFRTCDADDQRNNKAGKVSTRLLFTIEPSEGPASGGTQVTITFSHDLPNGPQNFHCAFGEKVVSAQSFFVSPEAAGMPALLCQTPAAQARSTVTVRVSLDGIKYSSGPRFYFHDPIGSVFGGSRALLSNAEQDHDL
mmetsp:Transcript_26559/g.36682  ORF Transcript_26559/g.36682 Transcript_26559/m.36682 type:complete len:152 (+) Transcript_26559:110-565(+)